MTTAMLPEWIVRRIAVSETGCWNWTGTIGTGGYGAYGGKGFPTRIAHRCVYLTLVGPIHSDLDLDHLCRNRRCVNPAHLEPVTRSENLRRSPLVGKYWAIKTHCKFGHPLSGDNVYLRPDRPNRRACRVCAVEATRRWRTRQATNA